MIAFSYISYLELIFQNGKGKKREKSVIFAY